MTTEVPNLTDLSTESVIGYARWKIGQQVTQPDDAWVERLSGPVRETPMKDHMDLGWLGTISEFADIAVGGIPLNALKGERVRRDYSEFANGLYVTRKERRNTSMIGIVQRRIDELAVTYGRIWPHLLLKTIAEAAANTATKRSRGIDDKVIYATDHVDPSDESATVSNRITFDVADHTKPLTVPEAEELLWHLVEQLMTRKDDHARPIHEDKTEFDVFCSWQLRRPFAYALGAEVILEAGESRTNLLSNSKSGVRFNLITTQHLSAMGVDEVAMHVSDGRSFWRGRDPESLIVETEDNGISARRTDYATFEERGAGAFDWQSGIHCTLN